MTDRFPDSVSTHEEAKAYYLNRAIQMNSANCILKSLKSLPFGVEAYFHYEGKQCRSLFILDQYKGNNFFDTWMNSSDVPYLVASKCSKMLDFLCQRNYDFILLENPYHNKCYEIISSAYENKKANRSGMFYMNHIDEGLKILDAYCLISGPRISEAWSVHPIVQGDLELNAAVRTGLINEIRSDVLCLAMEYRSWANAHLSSHPSKVPSYGTLSETRYLLIADKIQNRKDFDLYLKGRIPNSERLEEYFKEWFDVLNISEHAYHDVTHLLSYAYVDDSVNKRLSHP